MNVQIEAEIAEVVIKTVVLVPCVNTTDVGASDNFVLLTVISVSSVLSVGNASISAIPAPHDFTLIKEKEELAGIRAC